MQNSTLLIANMTSKAGQMGSIEVMDLPEPNLSLTCENACKNENEIHMIRKLVSSAVSCSWKELISDSLELESFGSSWKELIEFGKFILNLKLELSNFNRFSPN